MRACGLAPRRPSTNLMWLASRAFVGIDVDLGESSVQPLAKRSDQEHKPSCEGEAVGQSIEGATGTMAPAGEGILEYGTPGPLVSGVDLWEMARILQGYAKDAESGTRSEYMVDALLRHGWTDFVRGENHRPTSEDTDVRVGSSLADRMRAHHRRKRVVRHEVIDPHLARAELKRRVVSALRRPRTGIWFGGGCRELFFDAPPNAILGTEYRGGSRNGHAERIIGYDADLDCAIVQGSWDDWTWCSLPNGAQALGCYRASWDVLAGSWEIDVIEIAP